MTRGRAVLAAAALALLLPGCREQAFPRMVRLPPPPGWTDELTALRAAKDANFARPGSPLLEQDVAEFTGLSYWPADRNLYFAGPVNLYRVPEEFSIPSTSGKMRPCAKIGWIEFRLGDRDLTLQVYRLLDSDPAAGDDGLFLPFADATTGQETYPAGRYLDLVGPAGGPFVLDFNRAYNPLCAYGAPERYVCPRTPPENRLPVRIEAGERGFKLPPEPLPADPA